MRSLSRRHSVVLHKGRLRALAGCAREPLVQRDGVAHMALMIKLAALTDRQLIHIEGPDWRSFLQGLITQDVETLTPGEVAYGALLSPQGRLLFDMFLWAGAGGAVLDVDADSREALIARLSMYRLRSKVSITARDGAIYALFPDGALDGPVTEAAGWRRDPRLSALGWRGVGEPTPPPEAEPADLCAYHAHRIAVGVPDLAQDGLADKAYAVEADLDLLNGVDFSKGCFVGQETTSRMKRRGLVKTRLATLSFDGPAPLVGAEVLAEPIAGEAAAPLRAGEVLSGCEGRALALLRLDRAFGRSLSVQGRPVRFSPADWLTPALTPPLRETI